ncbi:uncharacterized protein LOC135486121 isoform X2 [Lineus longissimus]|uniref:uncharacterized protein LOC135486121 isoform X2 n=1 Tax=Lineus longissimus TaxID=88925 RepID=UPI00315D673B
MANKERKMSEVSEEIQQKYELPLLSVESVDETDGGFGPWENIVEKSMVGTGIMTDGAIIDRDGKIYGINDKFNLKKKQIKTIVHALYDDVDQTTIPKEGIEVGERKFTYGVRDLGDKMVGQDGESGIIIRCSRKFIIIGIYDGIEKKAIAEDMMVDLQRYFIRQDI